MDAVTDAFGQFGTQDVTIATADVAGLQGSLGSRRVEGVDALGKAVHLIIVYATEGDVSVRETHMVPTIAECLRIGTAQSLQMVIGGNGILSGGAIDDGTGLHVFGLDRHIHLFQYGIALAVHGGLPFLRGLTDIAIFELFLFQFLDSGSHTGTVTIAEFYGTKENLIASQPTADLRGRMFLGGTEYHRRLLLDGGSEDATAILLFVITQGNKDRVPWGRDKHLRLRFTLTRHSRQRHLTYGPHLEILLDVRRMEVPG